MSTAGYSLDTAVAEACTCTRLVSEDRGPGVSRHHHAAHMRTCQVGTGPVTAVLGAWLGAVCPHNMRSSFMFIDHDLDLEVITTA